MTAIENTKKVKPKFQLHKVGLYHVIREVHYNLTKSVYIRQGERYSTTSQSHSISGKERAKFQPYKVGLYQAVREIHYNLTKSVYMR